MQKKVVTVTSAGAGKRETHVDPDASAKAVSTLEQQTGMTLWRDTVTLKQNQSLKQAVMRT